MEPIQLGIHPVTDLTQLDALITKLEMLQSKGFQIPVNVVGNLEGLQKQLGGALSNIQAPAGIAASVEQAGVFTSSLVTKLKGLGEVDAARKLEAGFKSTGAEVGHLNKLYDEMTVKMRSAARNPQNLITGKMNDWEAALNLIALRTQQIAKGSREAMDAPRDRAMFDEARSARSRAARGGDEFATSEQNVAAAAKRSQSELAAQEAILSRKAGTFEKARTAAASFEKSEAGVAAQSGKAAAISKQAAVSESALIRERLKNAKVVERTFAESAGTTRREPAASNAPVFTNVDRLREAQAAVRGVTTEARNHIAMMKSEGATAREMNAVYRAYGSQLDRISIKYKDLDQVGATSIGRQATALRQLGQRGLNAEARATERQQQAAETALQKQRSAALLAQERERQRIANQKPTTSGGGKGPLGDISGTVKNAATFIAVYRALDLVIQGLEAGIKASVEFERRVATLSIIFRGTKAEARELAIESMRVASAFGQNGIEAIQVATDFARFGLTQTQTLEAVRVVSMAANVAQIDLAESSKHFQAIMAGYSLDAGQLASVLGSLNTISNTYNVTTKSLLDGLARVAPLARQAGIGLNELAGFEAVITGRTSRPGAEAGNALKALISRLSKPVTQSALQDVGVNVHDQTGELKAATQIINEMFVSIQNLTRAEQQELIVKVAGTHQASRIAALMDGYITSQELSIRASRDLTSSDRENLAVRATLSSQLGTLSTQWQRFWVSSSGSGLAAGVQGSLTEITKTVSNLIGIMADLQDRQAKGAKGTGGAPSAMQRTVAAVMPFGPGTINTLSIFNSDVERLRKNLGGAFKTDAEKAAEGLIRFNSEAERLQKLGEGEQAAERFFKTLMATMKNASPEKLEAMIRSAAQVGAPGNLPEQENIREELNNLAKQGNFLEINARFAQFAAEAHARGAKNIKDGVDVIDQEIGKQAIVLSNLQKQRSEQARLNRKPEVESLDKQIEQKRNEIENLRTRLAGTAVNLFPEGEEAYKSEPIDPSKIKSSVAAIAKELASSKVTTKAGELDKDILEARLVFELEKRKIGALQERGRVSKEIAAEAIATLQKERDATIENIEFGRQFADIIDRQSRARKEAGQAAKGFRSGRNESEDIARERAGLTGAARRDQTTGIALNIGGAREDISAARTVEDRAAAIARLQEFGNRLEDLGVDTLGRKLTLEAEITREREKQALETSKNLLMADRETQLRAALAQKLIQSRGGKGFTAAEFGFFDQKDKSAISQTTPGLLPPEMQSRMSDLTREYAVARDELASYNSTLSAGRKIQEEATKALSDLLQKVVPKAGPDGQNSTDPTKLAGFETLSRTMDNGANLITGTLDRLSQMIEGRDRAFAGAIDSLADQVSRFSRGSLQTAIGKAQGAAQGS